jgi:hypothetical protein
VVEQESSHGIFVRQAGFFAAHKVVGGVGKGDVVDGEISVLIGGPRDPTIVTNGLVACVNMAVVMLPWKTWYMI